jgi:glycosyltransferase involved in cell wall biosynthesis
MKIIKIVSYIHPSRTYLPCSGVGRHVNNLLLAISRLEEAHLSLVYSKQWLLDDGKLPQNAPLRNLPFTTFPWKERLTERSWKSVNWPKMDATITGDWMFSPVDTRFPVKNKKTAITIHDLQAFETDLPWSSTIAHQKFKKRWGLWVKKATAQADIVFTVSDYSRGRLIDLLNLDPQKVKVSGNAIDPVFLAELSNIPPKIKSFPYLSIIGGLRLKKGGNEILALALKLKKEWPEMKLVIWGENEPDLIEKANDIGNIISLDMISDEEMISWLKGAFASLFLSWYEGFGIPILEAMACGVPVISSNKASLPEVAGDGAYLVSPEDIQGIFYMLKKLEKPEKRAALIKRGFLNIERFSWDKCAENVVNALANFK